MSVSPSAASVFSQKDIVSLALAITVGVLTVIPGVGAWYEVRRYRRLHDAEGDLEGNQQQQTPHLNQHNTSETAPYSRLGIESNAAAAGPRNHNNTEPSSRG
ncbi:MAG: hypothetical protein M1840_003073 [Geoglossum simile]|nr:MAG: hypothetical protein M1840_003073 [Geoglossum simile]